MTLVNLFIFLKIISSSLNASLENELMKRGCVKASTLIERKKKKHYSYTYQDTGNKNEKIKSQ